jgi:hypothetical protein
MAAVAAEGMPVAAVAMRRVEAIRAAVRPRRAILEALRQPRTRQFPATPQLPAVS